MEKVCLGTARLLLVILVRLVRSARSRSSLSRLRLDRRISFHSPGVVSLSVLRIMYPSFSLLSFGTHCLFFLLFSFYGFTL